VFIMLVTAQFIYAKRVTALSPANVVTFADGKTTIDIAGMKDGDLWRYSANIDAKEVRFLLYKKSDGKVATIMDACAICGSVGFYNSGAQGITCKNCNAPINPDSVGEGGGCNPIPLEAQVSGNSVTVLESAVVHGASQVKE
jgi:uncharacterized membrane protein